MLTTGAAQNSVNFTNENLDSKGSSFHSNPQDRAVLKMMTNLRSVLAMGGPMFNSGKASMCSVLFKSAIKSVLKNKKQTRMPENLVEILEQGLSESEAIKDIHNAAWGLRKTLDAVYDAYVDMYCGVSEVRFRPVHKQISNVISLAVAMSGPNSAGHQLELYLKASKGIIGSEKLSEQSTKMLKDAISEAEGEGEISAKAFALRKALDYIYDEVRLPEVYEENESKNDGESSSKEKEPSKEAVLLDFTGKDEAVIKLNPRLLNDTCMGGESKSEFNLKESEAVFDGSVSTVNDGGFASVRFHSDSIDELRKVLKGCTGFIITAKNLHEKSRCFKLQLASEKKMRAFNYQSQIVLPPKEDYSSTFLHISTFWPTMFGHCLSNPGSVDTDKVDTIGFMVSKLGDNGKPNPDFVEGDFSVAIKQIKIVY